MVTYSYLNNTYILILILNNREECNLCFFQNARSFKILFKWDQVRQAFDDKNAQG